MSSKIVGWLVGAWDGKISEEFVLPYIGCFWNCKLAFYLTPTIIQSKNMVLVWEN